MNTSGENLCDSSTFEKVFNSTNEKLVNFLYYKFGDLEKSKNFAQDAFIKLWNNCKDVSFDKAVGFLYTTSKRLFLDEFAHAKVALKFVDRAKAAKPEMESTDDQVREGEFKEALEAAISNLPEKQRMVFLMNRIDKMKYAEIAASLDISVKTVEKHMSQSLIKIKEGISEFGTFKF